ncbi:MAG: flagellin lysine-N-methylase [Selenomonadaceae bacterium]|nr:flagellin lysine-N-methylase [Selenomonadaceae bacterium]
MAKKYLYFQPEYVSKFKCDGGKYCLNNCCEREWNINIDDATYKKYSRLKPKSKAKEITSRMKFYSKRGNYVIKLKENCCPFLTKKSLCRLQLEHGEEFLSMTCATYPRRTNSFGTFFERSLTLTCPVAAEMILFAQEPMKFEFVEVPDEVHSKHGRIEMEKLPFKEHDAEIAREIQIAMISILQERRFTINQRLIALGLFLDNLEETISSGTDNESILNLIAAYQSEEFLLREMPPLFQSFAFDAKNFTVFMMKFISHTSEHLKDKKGYHFLCAFTEILGIKPDENNEIPLLDVAANYELLVDAHKNFSENYSTFLENYLVNELFMDHYPWRFNEESITKNFAIFLISYKIFELMMFTAAQKGFSAKEDLLTFVDWFTLATAHNKSLYKKFLELLKGIDNTYLLMRTLL